MLGHIGVGPRQKHPPLRYVGQGRPQFLAVYDPLVTVSYRGGGQSGDVGARTRLREQLAPDLLGGEKWTQEPLLLLLGTVSDDGRRPHAVTDHIALRHGRCTRSSERTLDRRLELGGEPETPVALGKPDPSQARVETGTEEFVDVGRCRVVLFEELRHGFENGLEVFGGLAFSDRHGCHDSEGPNDPTTRARIEVMELPSNRTVDANGLRLELLELGEGGKPLLVLHGFCGAKENFAELMVVLAARGWHVVAPDQRGHGGSEHPVGEGAYSFDLFVEDGLALADVLGWRRFSLLGHSMGGMVSQLIATRGPSRLQALVLMDTFHSRIEIEPEMAEAGRQIVEAGGMPALVEAMRGLDGPLVTEAHRRLLTERDGYQEQLDAQTLACSSQMWLAMSAAMFDARDLVDDLRTLRLPVLVIVGEQDKPFLDASRRMSEAIPGARLAVIAEAGHSPQLEAPTETIDVLTRFLDSNVG